MWLNRNNTEFKRHQSMNQLKNIITNIIDRDLYAWKLVATTNT